MDVLLGVLSFLDRQVPVMQVFRLSVRVSSFTADSLSSEVKDGYKRNEKTSTKPPELQGVAVSHVRPQGFSERHCISVSRC